MPASWQPCPRSSAIQAFRYDQRRRVLEVLYRTGSDSYSFPCPEEMYEDFLDAPSPGRYLRYILRPYAERRGVTKLSATRRRRKGSTRKGRR